MSYTNLNNPANYQLQSFGQDGMRTISTTQAYVEGEYYRVLVATEDSTVSATSMVGDDLVEVDVFAGTTIYGLFTAVSVSLGEVTAYLAGRTDIDDVWAYISAYGEANGAIIEGEDCAKAAISPLLDKYYAQASLVMVPSLYKTSIVYSERPLSTDGELTFTRASNATRVGPDGLLEKVRTNLILQSNTFSNNWTNLSTTETGGQPDKDGGTTAWKLVGDTTNGRHYLVQNIAASNELTLSIYAKAAGNNFIQLASAQTTGEFANFDLSTGTVGTLGSSFSNSTIESVGGGWYRISATNKGNGINGFYISLISSNTAGWLESWAMPNNTDGVLIMDGQLEAGDIATDYIATTTSARSTFAGITVDGTSVPNVPRLDYSGGASCPSLLLEPQRTNLVAQSEYFGDSSWAKTAATTEIGFLSPEGNLNATKLLEDSSTSIHRIYQTSTVSASPNATISVYVKYNGRKYVLMRIADSGVGRWYDIEDGVLGGTYSGTPNNSTIESVGNGWYRISISHTVSSVARLELWVSDTESISAYAGDVTKGVYLYGAQLEAGAYATSYIPTLGTAVTRAADSCSKTGISSLIGQSEGTLFLEMNINKRADLGGSGPNGLEIKDSSGNNVIIIGTVYGPSQTFRVSRRDSGSFSTLLSTTNNALGTYKLAAAYSSVGFVFYVNGVQIGTSATLPPSATFADLGLMQVFGTNNPNGELVNQALLFKTRLTNAQLAELTTL